jgi:hypothetical protein
MDCKVRMEAFKIATAGAINRCPMGALVWRMRGIMALQTPYDTAEASVCCDRGGKLFDERIVYTSDTGSMVADVWRV